MSESLLTVLKFCLLALIYLFLLRVVRLVVVELRAPAPVADPPPVPSPRRETETRAKFVVRVLAPETRRGEVLPIDNDVTVGRAGGCALVLADDTFVSQVHARVFPRGGQVWVEDLGSTNGTYVNGEKIDGARRLRRGDRVQIGQTVLEVSK